MFTDAIHYRFLTNQGASSTVEPVEAVTHGK